MELGVGRFATATRQQPLAMSPSVHFSLALMLLHGFAQLGFEAGHLRAFFGLAFCAVSDSMNIPATLSSSTIALPAGVSR